MFLTRVYTNVKLKMRALPRDKYFGGVGKSKKI